MLRMTIAPMRSGVAIFGLRLMIELTAGNSRLRITSASLLISKVFFLENFDSRKYLGSIFSKCDIVDLRYVSTCVQSGWNVAADVHVREALTLAGTSRGPEAAPLYYVMLVKSRKPLWSPPR